ncbi:MAG: hypothetical protein WD939_06685 [Dehalococcoidia bacterium]
MRIVLPVVLLSTLFVAAACSPGGDNDRMADIIHGLLLAAGTEGSESLESFVGELPPDLPAEPPLYPEASLVVSSRQPAPFDFEASPGADPAAAAQPVLYFIVLDTPDSRDDVFSFYESALDQDPWQVQGSFSTAELDTLQFFNVDDIDIAGAVSIAEEGGGDRTLVLISMQDAGAFLDEQPPFELKPSLPAPKEFPPDVPLYAGATVTGTAFFREPGSESFLLVFLTTDAQEDVIEFYREAFQGYGWTVQDTSSFGLEGQIDFRDASGDIQGDVLADRYPRSRDYTEVRIQVEVNPSRVPAGEATPDGEGPAAG